MTRRIEVVPYDSAWPKLFDGEIKKIKHALTDNCIAIHHIGSTAIPRLCAKPTIDILLVVKNTDLITTPLEVLGYQYKGEFNIPFRLSFTKRGVLPKVNLHVYAEGNPEIELNLLFRDFLRNHPESRSEYADLKLNLVSQDSLHEKKNSMFSGYNLGKDAFIKKILNQAEFKGLCMRLCTHYEEWEAVRSFRQKYFFDKVPISDPYTWTFDHKDHIHLVFYKGTEIIGYAHVQLWPEQRAALRIIVIDEPLRNHNLGSHFLNLCERWLKQQNIKVLHAQSSPAAYPFYHKNNYIEMAFNDPEEHEGCPQDIDVGKVL